MDSQQQLKFYFDRKNYFSRFLTDLEVDIHQIIGQYHQIRTLDKPINRTVRHALEYFVNDLRLDRNRTIERFLEESNVDDILRAIAQLLLSNDDR